jgi:hypothetical protein
MSGLYVLFILSKLYFSHQFKFGSTNIWHQCLGHFFYVLQLLKNKCLINVIGVVKLKHICDSY